MNTLINFIEKNLYNNLNKAKNLIEKLEKSTNTNLNNIFLTKLFDKDYIQREYLISKIKNEININSKTYSKNDNNNYLNLNKLLEKNEEIFSKISNISELKAKINKSFWEEFRKELKITSGNPLGNLVLGSKEEIQKKKIFESNKYLKTLNDIPNKKMNDIETVSIGEICFATLHTPGLSEDQYSIVITHVSNNSTKIPFLFPGEILQIASCGMPYANSFENCKKLFDSLKIYLSLPNDTLIYPNKNTALDNLDMCKKIDSQNEFITDKIKWAQESQKRNDNVVGSRLIEERFINPVYRLDESVYSKIFGDGSNRYKKFENFIKLKELINKQIEINNSN